MKISGNFPPLNSDKLQVHKNPTKYLPYPGRVATGFASWVLGGGRVTPSDALIKGLEVEEANQRIPRGRWGDTDC